jgi:hypothetical protein
MPLTTKHGRGSAVRLTGSLAARVVVVAALAVVAGCRTPEPPEAAQARNVKRLLEEQLVQLAGLVDATRRGELLTDAQIAIGLSESLIERLLTASLPSDRVLAGRLHIQLETVRPFFRGGTATILFRARVSSTNLPDANVSLELAGGLRDVRLEKGRLTARVSLVHFTVLESFGGGLGKNLVEDALRANLDTIEGSIPPLEIPVYLEEGVEFRGLREGPILVGAGRLPLAFTLARVVPVNERLWLLVQAAAGEWESRPAVTAAPGP